MGRQLDVMNGNACLKVLNILAGDTDLPKIEITKSIFSK
jgi:hypothetical protein